MNAQQFKNSILQFAMQGELVEQIPSEEPVKDLLKKIREEKDQLIKDKKIKKEQPYSPVTPEEVLFDIPETWQWVRLSEISTYIQRGKSPKYSDEEKIPVISQKCVQWSGFSILPAKFIDPESLDKYEKIRFLQDGDILWNSTGLGTVGRVAIYEEKRNPYLYAVADSHVTIVRCSKNIFFEYVNYYLSSFYIQSRILELTSGTTKQKELNTSTVKNILVPLPPVKEQQRIVTKIKVLESEIDRYGELYELNKTIESKFPVSIEKSILQYAMQGKLIEQNANHEPVSELLEKIKEEKEELQKNKIIKKEKAQDPINEEELPFKIPDSWRWVRLNDICTYIQRGKSPQYSVKEEIPVISQKCVQWNGFTIEPARFIDPLSFDKYEKIRHLQDGDILWNSTGLGTVGRVAVYKNELNPFSAGVVDSHVTIVRCSSLLSYKFVYYYLSSFYIQSKILELTSGTTKQRELNTSTVKSVLIPLPPVEEQIRIILKIEELLDITKELQV